MQYAMLSPAPSEKLLGPGFGPSVWPLRERLALATALLDVDNQQASWQSISKRLSRFTPHVGRPRDWCSARACAKQYALLLDSAELSRRQKFPTEAQLSRLHILHSNQTSTVPSSGLSVTERLVKRLTAERVDELRDRIQLGQKFYTLIKTVINELEQGLHSTQLEPMCRRLGIPQFSETPNDDVTPDNEQADPWLTDFFQLWSQMELFYNIPETTWVCPPRFGLSKIGKHTNRSSETSTGPGSRIRFSSLFDEASTNSVRQTTKRQRLPHKPGPDSQSAATRAAVATRQRYLTNAARNRFSNVNAKRGPGRSSGASNQDGPASKRMRRQTSKKTDAEHHKIVSTPSTSDSNLFTSANSGASTPSTTAMFSSDTEDYNSPLTVGQTDVQPTDESRDIIRNRDAENSSGNSQPTEAISQNKETIKDGDSIEDRTIVTQTVSEYNLSVNATPQIHSVSPPFEDSGTGLKQFTTVDHKEFPDRDRSISHGINRSSTNVSPTAMPGLSPGLLADEPMVSGVAASPELPSLEAQLLSPYRTEPCTAQDEMSKENSVDVLSENRHSLDSSENAHTCNRPLSNFTSPNDSTVKVISVLDATTSERSVFQHFERLKTAIIADATAVSNSVSTDLVVNAQSSPTLESFTPAHDDLLDNSSISMQSNLEVAVQLSPCLEADYVYCSRVDLEDDTHGPAGISTNPPVTLATVEHKRSHKKLNRKRKPQSKSQSVEGSQSVHLSASPFVSLPALGAEELQLLGLRTVPTSPMVALEAIKVSPSDKPIKLHVSPEYDHVSNDSVTSQCSPTVEEQPSLKLRFSRRGSHMTIVPVSSASTSEQSSSFAFASPIRSPESNVDWINWSTSVINDCQFALDSFFSTKNSSCPNPSVTDKRIAESLQSVLDSIMQQIRLGSVASRPQFVHRLLSHFALLSMTNPRNSSMFQAVQFVYQKVRTLLTTRLGD